MAEDSDQAGARRVMNSPDPSPKLPLWIFLVSDVALIGAATLIALRAPQPLSTSSILWIVVCVGLGALVALVPLIARYERQKNAALDERQQALEALARTVTSSAEQLSIATNGLNQIADLALKNLRMAEHLPHKLQDKIAEFQAQISAATDTEKEELERELLALRTTESERLETVSQRIAKSSADWAKLETATQQHLDAANEAIAKLAMGTANAIGKAQAAAEQALSQARIEATRLVGDAAVNASRSLATAKSEALAALDAKVATLASEIVTRVGTELSARLASANLAREAVASTPDASAAPAVPSPHVSASTSAVTAPTPPAIASASESSPTATGTTAQPPKRPRKTRREDAEPTEENATAPASSAPPAPIATPAAASVTVTSPAASEPQPIPATTIPEITPVVPATAEPFSGHIGTVSNGSSTPPATPAPATPPITAEPAKPARKRSPKPTADEEPSLGLDLGEPMTNESASSAESGLSSDGATRLLVTAYIGIGNRLYIRGQGPGLSWEKGVPLQFVSIGKWRWETNDAETPIQFKLYKNDDLECASLGAQSLAPGHQQEVTAAF